MLLTPMPPLIRRGAAVYPLAPLEPLAHHAGGKTPAIPTIAPIVAASRSEHSRPVARNVAPVRRYNVRMSMQVEAVYERGMLKPLQPLDLAENEHVQLLITPAAHTPSACHPDIEFAEGLRDTLQNAGPAPGLDEVRRRLSKIPGMLTSDFIAEREDR